MFDIFTPDTLRRSVESASGQKATILYDDKGLPSYMSVIPKMTLGDVFPLAYLEGIATPTETHAAFVVTDGTGTYEVDKIFISQYKNFVTGGRAVSMPMKTPARSTIVPITSYCEDKGTGWHLMNGLEYGLLWAIAMSEDKNIKGNTLATYVDGTFTTNESNDWTAPSNIYDIFSADLQTADYNALIVGDIIELNNGINVELLAKWPDYYGFENDGTTNDYFLMVQTEVGDYIGDATQLTTPLAATAAVTSMYRHEVPGMGQSSWAHDHSTWGVWNLMGAQREIVDSVWLKNQNPYYFLQSVRTNYGPTADRDVLSMTAKYSYDGGYLHLGYQPLSGQTAIAGGDGDITNNPGWRRIFSALDRSAAFTASTTDADKTLLKVLGLDTMVWPTNQNTRHEGQILTLYGEASGNRYMIRGGWQNSTADEMTMYSASWGSGTPTTLSNHGWTFRTAYVPGR
jgi:hypothetical protein